MKKKRMRVGDIPIGDLRKMNPETTEAAMAYGTQGLVPGKPMAFAGLRVLDLSRVLAGPYCGQLLADFGADVIKVETLEGDENRRWEPMIEGQSANFLSVNRGKRAMTLNLKSDSGQKILQALIAKSDVVIDSFLPQTAERLGVTHSRLRAIKNDLIHVSITGYGYQGPMANLPGYDLTLQAFTGMMAMTGEPDGAPIRAGASFIDMTTGILAFSGVSTALYARLAGHAQGQHITVSLMETGIALLSYHAVDFSATGRVPPRSGSGVWHLVPYQAFRTADGWMLVGATNDGAWQRLCSAIGTPELSTHPDYATSAARIEHKPTLIALLKGIFKAQASAYWLERLKDARVACAPINDIAGALSSEQVAATQMIVEVQDEAPEKPLARKLVGTPVNLSDTPACAGNSPPYLGQHTDEILAKELGMTNEQIRKLHEEGAV